MSNTVASKTRAFSTATSKARDSSAVVSKTRASSTVATKSRTSSTTVRARIDEKTKDEAAAVLASIGLTVSDAFRLMMVRIAKEKALPFEPLIPNAETIKAMKAARAGQVKSFETIDELMADLNAED